MFKRFTSKNKPIADPVAAGDGPCIYDKVATKEYNKFTVDEAQWAERDIENFRNRPMTTDDIFKVVARVSNGFDEFDKYGHMDKVHTKIQDLYNDNQLLDVSIRCGNRNFGCHLEVLAAHSQLLRQANDPVRPRLEMIMDSDIPSSTLERFLSFCYFNQLEIDLNNVYGILRIATKFQVNIVARLCRAFLHRVLTAANVIYTLESAQQTGCEDLYNLAYAKVVMKFYEITDDRQFLQWDVGKVISYFGLPDLQLHTEFDVFKSCFKWIDADRLNRVKYMREVFQRVNFTHMTKEELVLCAKYDPLSNENGEIREMISDANWSLTMSEHERKWSQIVIPPVRPKPTVNDV